MISFIPELEVVRAVADENITSAPAKIRMQAFEDINRLIAHKYNGEMLIEGILYNVIEPKLNDEHKKAFELLYNIDNSAVDVANYNITKAIQFISKNKVDILGQKVIIITENLSKYRDFTTNKHIRVLTPQDIIRKLNLFHEIRNDYESDYSALYTILFLLPVAQ